MSKPTTNKRKKPETNLPGLMDAERAILDLIRGQEDKAISELDIKRATNIQDTNTLKKLLKPLLSRNLIKTVVNVNNKRTRHYICSEFEASEEVTGGVWYSENGELDKALIDVLKKMCLKFLSNLKVATLDTVHSEVKKAKIVQFNLSPQQTAEIMKTMILDKSIIEVKSTGMDEYRSIPIGSTCFRVAPSVPKMGVFASIPCAACPRINLCTPDGAISPITCVYYTKWLEF